MEEGVKHLADKRESCHGIISIEAGEAAVLKNDIE